MDGGEKFWVLFWGIVGLVLINLTICLSVNDRLNTADFIRAGYTQEILPGNSTVLWVKK